VIIGLGPTFLFPLLLKLPKTPDTIQYTGKVLGGIGRMAKVFDYILLVSGLLIVWKPALPFLSF
jgi:hypothetical protein